MPKFLVDDQSAILTDYIFLAIMFGACAGIALTAVMIGLNIW